MVPILINRGEWSRFLPDSNPTFKQLSDSAKHNQFVATAHAIHTIVGGVFALAVSLCVLFVCRQLYLFPQSRSLPHVLFPLLGYSALGSLAYDDLRIARNIALYGWQLAFTNFASTELTSVSSSASHGVASALGKTPADGMDVFFKERLCKGTLLARFWAYK